MSEENYRLAPPGFTPEQWEIFDRDGIIFLEDALNEAEVAEYRDAIDRTCRSKEKYVEGGYFSMDNIVEADPAFTGLIDHPRHVGYAYDFFGEQLKVHQSQFFVRPPGGKQYNIWHPDGARVLPYGVFSPQLPLQIKIGYWLTDLPEAKMGNLVVLPGSHRHQYMDGYDTHEPQEGERIVRVKPGTLTVMHSSIWHRVEPNESDTIRKNLFMAYCPAWVTAADRLSSDPAWLETLNREQRIIMRSYEWSYHNAKPPAKEFPLFLDRDTGLDSDEGTYRDHVQLQRRKRLTAAEKRLVAANV
jgi:hypothetical protein